MAHNTLSTKTNIAERDFNDYVQRGHDFFKIELFRPAKSWYNKALQLREQEEIIHQVAECNRLIDYERKVRRVLFIIACVIVISILVVSKLL